MLSMPSNCWQRISAALYNFWRKELMWLSLFRRQARARHRNHPRRDLFCRWEKLGFIVLRESSPHPLTCVVEPFWGPHILGLTWNKQKDSLCRSHPCLLAISTRKHVAAFSKWCQFLSGSLDKLSSAHGPWPQLAAGSIPSVPNANKVRKTHAARKHQSFLASFQTYYFLLFLESFPCSLKTRTFSVSCSMVYFKPMAVFVYIQC